MGRSSGEPRRAGAPRRAGTPTPRGRRRSACGSVGWRDASGRTCGGTRSRSGCAPPTAASARACRRGSSGTAQPRGRGRRAASRRGWTRRASGRALRRRERRPTWAAPRTAPCRRSRRHGDGGPPHVVRPWQWPPRLPSAPPRQAGRGVLRPESTAGQSAQGLLATRTVRLSFAAE